MHRVMDMYAEFVQLVDPTRHVLDRLIQDRIVDFELAQEIRRQKSDQECCRTMLHELLKRGNPKAFIVLRQALKKNYNYIVERIDAAGKSKFSWPSGCPPPKKK